MFVFVLGNALDHQVGRSQDQSAADFTTGGGITGFQNGLAIAGDYMSAASFLGISAHVMASGYDGLIYSIGFLVGWPIITFLMAERLRATWASSLCRRGGLPLRQGRSAPLHHRARWWSWRDLPDRTDGRRRPAHQAAGAWNTGWPWPSSVR